MEVLLDWAGDSILAVVDAIQNIKPTIDGHGYGVELDTVNEGGRSAVDALGCTIFPERSKVVIRIIRVCVAVAAGDIRLFKAELGGDLLGPPGLKVVL